MNNLPLPLFRNSPPRGISTFRMKEKYLLMVGVALFVCVCYSTFVLLPSGENRARSDGSVTPLNVRARLHNILQQPAQFVLPPPDWANPDANNKSFKQSHHDLNQDPHQDQDRSALRQKIDDAQIPAPKDQEQQIKLNPELDQSALDPADPDPTQRTKGSSQDTEKMEKVREMMRHAWDNYEKYAWGANELRPVSKSSHSASIFGSGKMGATIIDGMDTLHIMGLMDRFEKGKKWIEMTMNLKDMRGDLSVFETNIRFVGGLLTLYALTKDEIFKTRAKEFADLLMPAFNTPTGIPMALINANSKNSRNWGWASGGSSILSEFGTLHMEFVYMSYITGDAAYANKVHAIRDFVDKMEKPGGLYPNYINPKTGKWGTKHVSMGALGDSFYEYLVKTWVLTNKQDTTAKRMYEEAMKALEQQLIVKSKSGLTYFAEMRGTRVDHKMDHLACFSAGMMALHSMHESDEEKKTHWLQIGADVANTCHESYIRTSWLLIHIDWDRTQICNNNATHYTGIGPESFRFTNEFEAKTINEREKYYILRPEVIEGWFYMWRATHQQKYRDWAWTAIQSIEKYCRVDNGYSGIRSVYSDNPTKDDVQQSFFLAETLKYLYLIFTDDSVMSLNEWVFNTEAHPLPVANDYIIQLPATV